MFKRQVIVFPIFFILLSMGVVVFGLDDQGNPNDPTINPRANACYEDGTLAGQCDTNWEWEGGWYLIRYQVGLISLEAFPTQYMGLVGEDNTNTVDVVPGPPPPATTETPGP